MTRRRAEAPPAPAPRIAVYAGSFDPVTLGHIDILRRGLKLFDRIIVAIGVNSTKSTLFTLEERRDILLAATASMENVEVDTFRGLLVDYAERRGASAIIRGLRAVTDFEHEFQVGLANMALNPHLETIFLATGTATIFLSSSLVKDIARNGGDVTRFLPDASAAALTAKVRGGAL